MNKKLDSLIHFVRYPLVIFYYHRFQYFDNAFLQNYRFLDQSMPFHGDYYLFVALELQYFFELLQHSSV